MPNPFQKYVDESYPFWYKGQMLVSTICGGVPADENTAEKWVETKVKDTRSAAMVKELVEKTKRELRETHAARARVAAGIGGETDLITVDELDEETEKLLDSIETLSAEDLEAKAMAKAAKDLAGLNIFKRTEQGVLHIEGRQLKAALKEAVAVAANAGKITTKGWGNPDNASYKKGIKQWFPEHVFVTNAILCLYREDGTPVTEPDETLQKFVHTHRGDAISYEEAVHNASIRFTVKTDVDLTEKQWAMVWLTGQDQGLGASRSQGFGTYEMTDWRRLESKRERDAARSEDTHPELLGLAADEAAEKAAAEQVKQD